MMRTFKIGGVHPHDNKISAHAAIEDFPLPERACVSMSQHLGAPAKPVVGKGDKVLAGQLIAEASSFVSAPVHSPVSGTVEDVAPLPDLAGNPVMHIIIRTEGDEWLPGIDLSPELKTAIDATAEEIREKVKDCGIVGLGGAAFPTFIKLTPQKQASCLILNGTECEPYITSDDRIMRERPDEIVVGARIMMKALGVELCYIGIEANKPQAIEAMRKASSKYEGISVEPLRKKYPQGGEKQLADAILGKRIPSQGLPIDIGTVVQNVGTALAVYEAVQKNKPLVDNVVTVTGSALPAQKNYKVRIGTPYSMLLQAAGGLPEGEVKLISGGPMMGRAIAFPEAATVKATSSLLVLSGPEIRRGREMNCIRCAKCSEACPMGLEPWLLNKLSRASRHGDLEAERIYDCIECGCCQFTCPSCIPLLDVIRNGKGEVMKIMRSRNK